MIYSKIYFLVTSQVTLRDLYTGHGPHFMVISLATFRLLSVTCVCMSLVPWPLNNFNSFHGHQESLLSGQPVPGPLLRPLPHPLYVEPLLEQIFTLVRYTGYLLSFTHRAHFTLTYPIWHKLHSLKYWHLLVADETAHNSLNWPVDRYVPRVYKPFCWENRSEWMCTEVNLVSRRCKTNFRG